MAEITIVDVESKPVMRIRFQARKEEIGAKLGPVYGELMQYAMAKGAQPTSPPYAAYYCMTDGVFAMEGGFCVAEAIEGSGRIEASTLPAGKAATVMHVGPYEKLEETYAALAEWQNENGYEGEISWEVYLTDPMAEKDSSKWQTQVLRLIT